MHRHIQSEERLSTLLFELAVHLVFNAKTTVRMLPRYLHSLQHASKKRLLMLSAHPNTEQQPQSVQTPMDVAVVQLIHLLFSLQTTLRRSELSDWHLVSRSEPAQLVRVQAHP
eukprot:GHUV01026311.1.p3 GENE.GHUV01026311.1~~GHUV01026311.1.p3  ORF type:complete len:113 (+),score=17.40 GHUV01026311.1:2967-3305(+)